MCCSCTKLQKQITVWSCTTFFLVFGLVLAIIWPSVSLKLIYSSLVLKEGSKNYINWIETPIPMYFEVYLYNWDNPSELGSHTIKPHFTQKGPYVFKEVHKRVGLDWNENSTVSYNQTRTWHFIPEKSNGSLDDEITNLNVIATTVALIARPSTALKLLIDGLFLEQNTQLFIKKTARELIFDGYNDPILELLKKIKNSSPFNLPIPDIPFTKFGWFAERNNSADYDGRFTIFTGADDINKLGLMNLWNHKNKSPFYRKDCRGLKGTTGELWPPVKAGDDISVFATDLCRSLTLKYDGEISKFGLTGGKWSGDDRVFDNGVKYPSQLCFCTSNEEQCPDMPAGVGNMSDCRFGAPAFASFPHFYLADKSFLNAVDGLAEPNQKDDEFFIALEPKTGIPMEVNAQLQINILLQPVSNLVLFNGIPKVMVPMMWFKQTIELTEELANQAKLALLVPKLGIYTSYGFTLIGFLLTLTAVYLTVTKSWKKEEEDDTAILITNDDVDQNILS